MGNDRPLVVPGGWAFSTHTCCTQEKLGSGAKEGGCLSLIQKGWHFLIPLHHTIPKETCFGNLTVPNPGQELKYNQNLGRA